MNSFDEVFDAVKAYCLQDGKIGEIAKGLWLDKLEPVRLEGSDAVFYCESAFQKGVVENNYASLLLDGFQHILGFPVQLRLIVKTDKSAPAPVEESSFSTKEQREELQDILEQKSNGDGDYAYTFDTFIVGNSNQFAYAACTSIARGDGNGNTYNPLFIYGPSGLGKTHLLTAISHEMKKRDPNLKIIYVTGESFANELIEAITRRRDTSVFHDKYRSADVLLVDDVQFISGKESTQEEFFHTFNMLHAAGKQIVLTSDRPPKDIKILEERIRTRFESGLITDISMPEFETRVAIIQRKAELLDLDIPEDVAAFIANRLKTNIRQLEGAVKRLKAMEQLQDHSPSISMAQSVIRDILTDEQPTPVTVERIIAEVSNLYGVTSDDIRSKKRSQQISNARKVAIYLVHQITQMTLASIGEEFGNRDHSTIVYAVKYVEKNIKKDTNLRDAIDSIAKTIRDGVAK
ncbi:MAG: chromosomal replication initiator protein DnaA [Oscillospiraceae bacterium]|nr:chromosomal replication initiator protein DnaA [Oscillospiraceae bacterium]